MLIVVAIIAILIAISIPLINSALERAKHATDAANERAAKAEILIQYMADGGGTTVTPDTEYFYDGASGSLVASAPPAYGKHNNHDYIKVKVATSGVVTVKWNTGGGLCSAADVASNPHPTPVAP